MKTIFDYIEYAKTKPPQVRKQISFAIAAGFSGLIALVWLVGGLSLGNFALQGSSFADANQSPSIATVASDETDASSSGVAGVASAIQNANTPAHIEIVTTATSTSKKDVGEQTTIPF